MKICNSCEEEKRLDEFHKDSKGKYGRYHICIECLKKNPPDYSYRGGAKPMISAEQHNKVLLERIDEWDSKETAYIKQISDMQTILEYHSSKYSISDSFEEELLKALNYYNR